MKKIIPFILYVSLSVFALGQGKVNNFALSAGDRIEDVMLDFYDLEQFNGSILVVEKGEVIYENTFGYVDIAAKEPLDANAPFYLASLSKQFTAVAIMLLEKEGKLNYLDKLINFMPYLPKGYSEVTIHQLLTHTAGIRDYFDMGLNRPGLENADVMEALAKLKGPEFNPGQKYRYSNSGYVMLAMIIEIASGVQYPDYIKKEIFEPLGMTNAFVATQNTKDSVVVKGYDSKFRLDDYDLLTYGDGGIYATAQDLLKWERSIQNAELLDYSSLSLAFKPVTLDNGSERRYGYGWEIGNNMDGRFIYHSGGLAGFRTYMEQQLSEEDALIILSNNSSTKILEIRNTIVKIIDGRPYNMPSRD